MPHVVIRGDLTPREVWEAFQPLQVRSEGSVLKVSRAYLSHGETHVLLEAVAVSEGFRQQFLAQVSAKGEGALSVRLESMTDPEKTDAVRRTLALVAVWILGLKPGLETASSNIESFLEEAAEH